MVWVWVLQEVRKGPRHRGMGTGTGTGAGTGTGCGPGSGHNCSAHGWPIGSPQDWVGQLKKPPLLCLPVAAISALAPNPSGRCYLHARLFEV